MNARSRPDGDQAGGQPRLRAASEGLDRGGRRAGRAHRGRSGRRAVRRRGARRAGADGFRRRRRTPHGAARDGAIRMRAGERPQASLSPAGSRAAIDRALDVEAGAGVAADAHGAGSGHPGVLGGHVRQSCGMARRQSSARAGCCWSSMSMLARRRCACRTWWRAASSIRRFRASCRPRTPAFMLGPHDHAALAEMSERKDRHADRRMLTA